MKKQIAVILTGLMVCGTLFAGCGKNEATEAVKESAETEKEGTGDTETSDDKKSQDKKSDKKDSENTEADSTSEDNAQDAQTTQENLDKVGVFLPEEGDDINSSLERTELKSRLEEAGYNAALYFADGEADIQISQIRELLQDEKLKALVISPVDPYSLSEVLEEAAEQSVPVIDYDNLIMDSSDIKYFVTFNTRAIGNEIAGNIIKSLELDKVREDRGARTIEFLMGSPDDDASLFLFNGILEGLQEYIDDGTLICRSGRQTFDECSIMDEDTDAAMKQLKSVTDEFYSLEKTPDIICTASDDFALAAIDLLEKENLQPSEEGWPYITGVDADAKAVKSVAEGKMGFTILMDRRDLAEDCISLVDTYLKGEDVEISNYSQYDNGVKIIGTLTCDGKLIDKDNYQILVDSGFYLPEMIAPEASPTPVLENKISPTPEAEPEVTTEEVPEVKDEKA